jgi:predicted RNA binding protein YcfA (HicA-like mRNA interferase family)
MSLRNYKHRDVIKFLVKYEKFAVIRKSGSHFQLAHTDGRHTTVPRHDPIKEGTLNDILHQTNVSREKFLKFA